MAFINKIFGDPNKKILSELKKRAESISALEKEFEKKTQEDLLNLTQKFRDDLKKIEKHNGRQEYLNEVLPQAFATVREAAKRTLHQRHFDVQVIGAIVLHEGKISEMKTGEGKTLTSTMPIYLNALTGMGVHVITVNDYLARRDASWMGQIFYYLGLTISCLQQQNTSYLYDETVKKDDVTEAEENTLSFKVDMDHLRKCQRTDAYKADVIYGINSEFGFDYLRDNMVQELNQKVQINGQYYAIIDEVDSILIDEARTPLIISAPDKKSADLYHRFAGLIPLLRENEHFNKDEERHAVSLTEEGIKKMEALLGVENIYTEDVTLAHQLDQALKAHVLYKKDKDYVVRENEIIIVDQFTGRLMEGRRYSQGLHQAIEAKENVEVQQESKTLATITIQNYFRMYKKLAGMTGTAATEAEEFHKIYNLDVIEIPTNKPVVRDDKGDLIYKSEKGKFQAIAKRVREKWEKGQPVLIGTISIEKNEQLSEYLKQAGIPHKILNAKQHESEAEIIAQAGKLKAVTVATNMAGRGVDIVLGGNPYNPQEAAKVKELGGLCVIGSERHESRRIDNQLRGRSGRQGDAGESQFFISLEDDLMRIFGSDRVGAVMSRLGLPEDMPIENRIISRSIEKAQQKVEGHNFDIRKHLVEYDDVINKQRAAIYSRREEILKLAQKRESLSPMIMNMVKSEILRVIEFHAPLEGRSSNTREIKEVLESIPLEGIPDDLIIDTPNEKENAIHNMQTKAQIQYEEFKNELNETLTHHLELSLLLRTIDTLWVDHLDSTEHLRVGIGLRGYGQRDPLVEYKKESFQMYQTLLDEINKRIVYNIYKIFLSYKQVIDRAKEQNLNKKQPDLQKAASTLRVLQQNIRLQKKQETAFQNTKPSDQGNDPYTRRRHSDIQGDNYNPHDRNPETGKKIGRNDPCFCSSGKKYKRCHGA